MGWLSRRMLLLLCLLLGGVVVSIIPARAEAEIRWYWAWRERDGAVLAYNAFGDVNVLAEGTTPHLLRRLDEQSAVVILHNELASVYAYYHLTATDAHHIKRIETETQTTQVHLPYTSLLNRQSTVLPMKHPYVLVSDRDVNQHLIFNRETNTVHEDAFPEYSAIRLSDDGTRLRYTYPTELERGHAVAMRVAEYDSLTRTHRTIATLKAEDKDRIEVEHIVCDANTSGDTWYCAERSTGYLPNIRAWLVNADGTSQEISTELRFRVGMDGEVYFIQSDAYYRTCDEACDVSLYSVDMELINTFHLPSTEQTAKLAPHLVNPPSLAPEHVEVINTETLYNNWFEAFIIHASGHITYLGSTPRGSNASPKFEHYHIYVHADRNSGANHCELKLWDMLQGIVVIDDDMPCEPFHFTQDGLFILGGGSYSLESKRKFPFSSQAPIDIQEDGLMLYFTPFATSPGIYRNMPPNTQRVLVPNAEPISLWGS